MNVLTFIAVILLTAQTVSAETWSSSDFSNGYELTLPQHGAIHYLPLPPEVYSTVVQPTLADIRVFNGQGQTVPHLIKMEAEAPLEITSETILPFSPLYDLERTGPIRYVEIQVLTKKDKTGREIASSLIRQEREREAGALKMKGYLIETQEIQETPFRILLDIRAESDFMATLTLEDSDDLTTWSAIGTETVARFNYQGHLIEKHSDRLFQRKKKYLRLIWPATQPEFTIEQVRAISVTGDQPRERQWRAMTGKRHEDKDYPQIIIQEFDSQGFFPVDTVRVQFPRNNDLIQAIIKSRPDPDSPWRHQGSGIFYQVQDEDTALRHDILEIPLTADRYWRLEITADPGISPDSLPGLQLGWLPHNLYFLSQGPSPYILAFGNGAMSAEIGNKGEALNVLLKNTGATSPIIAIARILDSVELGGPAKLLPPEPPPPWGKWLLWAVLIGGVLMIAAMANSLYRQIGGSGKES